MTAQEHLERRDFYLMLAVICTSVGTGNVIVGALFYVGEFPAWVVSLSDPALLPWEIHYNLLAGGVLGILLSVFPVHAARSHSRELDLHLGLGRPTGEGDE